MARRRQRRAGRRRRLRPLALVVAVVTAAALVWWGIVASDGGVGQFWQDAAAPAPPAEHEAGGHGEITDAEREQLRDVLERIDREQRAR